MELVVDLAVHRGRREQRTVGNRIVARESDGSGKPPFDGFGRSSLSGNL